MKYSEVRTKHELEAEKAFRESGCTYFPGTKIIQRYRGTQLHQKLREYGHSSLGWENCICKTEMTVSCEQEWKEYWNSRGTYEQTG